MAQRDLYIDRLRTSMIALVVVFHAAITYGGSGGWFYHEVEASISPSSLLLTMFCATNQAYFMGFFFFLAGYFTPASLERKGYARFIGDRCLRLGLPLLAFGLILGPLTAAMVNFAQGDGFWSCIVWLWRHKKFINGPLWFTQALLIFSLAYCAWRAVFGAALSQTERTPRPVPAYRWWLVSAIGVGLAALAIRQFVPTGENVISLQLGYFSSYIFLFVLGIAAWRNDWLRQLEWKQARPWIWTLAMAWPCLPVGIAVAHALNGPGKSNFSGGLSWPAILYAYWEPFVAWGLIALWLLVFRARMNQPSALWAWLNRRAYTAYIIHPAVLVGVSLLLRGWVAPALVKWGVVGPLACIGCWLVADPLVRLPGVRRVI
ncbi:MAG: acyltransferase family protein [Terracidiphilus sp.]|jgi:fucose 4-O-acetylase-like acetyltransferase